MGFFDKIKAAANAVTGGGVNVYVECDPLAFATPMKVKIKVQTKDTLVKIDRVYLKIQGVERVEVQNADYHRMQNSNGVNYAETVRASYITIERDLTVADGQELEANTPYEWTCKIELPSDAPTVYRGRMCTHTYQIQAGLDSFGNDPDSGWIELN